MTRPPRYWLDRLKTPVGEVVLVADDEGRLCLLGFDDKHDRMGRQVLAFSERLEGPPKRATNPGGLTAALRAYFAGELAAIDELPVHAEGTEFQKRVWRALREIPCGETRSYGDIARRIGKPLAQRAVGLANNRNPIGIVVPCHRVIGADGSLTGYGGGMDRKRWLLLHERSRGVNGELLFDAAPARRAGAR